jgi:hypothetical protein
VCNVGCYILYIKKFRNWRWAGHMAWYVKQEQIDR